MSLSTTSTAAAFFRSSAIDRRLRSNGSGGAGSFARAEARSMRTICAPRSASIIEQNGAGPIAAISTILIPASGPMGVLLYLLL